MVLCEVEQNRYFVIGNEVPIYTLFQISIVKLWLVNKMRSRLTFIFRQKLKPQIITASLTSGLIAGRHINK